MQATVDEWVETQVLFDLGKGDTPPPGEDEDFGLYNPLDYAYETWMNWRRFGVYPEAGGYNDQDYYLMQDWKTLSRRYDHFWRVHQYKMPELDGDHPSYTFEELV